MANLPSSAKAQARTQAVCYAACRDSLLLLSYHPLCHQVGPSTQAHLHYTLRWFPGWGWNQGPWRDGHFLFFQFEKSRRDQKDCSDFCDSGPKIRPGSGGMAQLHPRGVKPLSLLPALPNGTVFKPFFPAGKWVRQGREKAAEEFLRGRRMLRGGDPGWSES